MKIFACKRFYYPKNNILGSRSSTFLSLSVYTFRLLCTKCHVVYSEGLGRRHHCLLISVCFGGRISDEKYVWVFIGVLDRSPNKKYCLKELTLPDYFIVSGWTKQRRITRLRRKENPHNPHLTILLTRNLRRKTHSYRSRSFYLQSLLRNSLEPNLYMKPRDELFLIWDYLESEVWRYTTIIICSDLRNFPKKKRKFKYLIYYVGAIPLSERCLNNVHCNSLASVSVQIYPYD